MIDELAAPDFSFCQPSYPHTPGTVMTLRAELTPPDALSDSVPANP